MEPISEQRRLALEVLQSWLRYRVKRGAGRRSSPLDEIRPRRWPSTFTQELLELIWGLEATLALYPEQARLLERVLAGPCLQAIALAPAPIAMRRPPASRGPKAAAPLC